MEKEVLRLRESENSALKKIEILETRANELAESLKANKDALHDDEDSNGSLCGTKVSTGIKPNGLPFENQTVRVDFDDLLGMSPDRGCLLSAAFHEDYAFDETLTLPYSEPGYQHMVMLDTQAAIDFCLE